MGVNPCGETGRYGQLICYRVNTELSQKYLRSAHKLRAILAENLSGSDYEVVTSPGTLPLFLAVSDVTKTSVFAPQVFKVV
jgi:hypothetical protein